jgi:hypothetical protein
LKSDLLTIEEINEIFKNQIKKLEESLNIEVKKRFLFNKIKFFIFP